MADIEIEGPPRLKDRVMMVEEDIDALTQEWRHLKRGRQESTDRCPACRSLTRQSDVDREYPPDQANPHSDRLLERSLDALCEI